MKRLLTLAILIISILYTRPLAAQSGYTTVTAQVVDANGTKYVNAPYTVTFFDPGTSGKLPLLSGSVFQQNYNGYATDGNGNLSISLPDNSIIASTSGATGTQWVFSICTAVGAYTTQFCIPKTSITISGASQNISAALTAVAPILPVSVSISAGVSGNLPKYTGAVSLGDSGIPASTVPGLNFVSSLPVSCTPGVTQSVQLTGSPYQPYFCLSSGVWVPMGGGSFGATVAGGTAQAQTVSITPPLTIAGLGAGVQVCWLPVANNTGSGPTLAGAGSSTFTAKAITKGINGGTALVANDITTSIVACAIYDGTQFELQNPQTNIVGAYQTNIYGAFLQDFTSATMEIPEAAGFTTNVNSTIGLDTTNNNCHIWENNADALCLAEASAPAANTILKQTDATHGLASASGLTDNGTTVSTAENITASNLTGGTLAVKPLTGQLLRFADATSGNSANDGLSWGSPLDTPNNCLAPLITAGGGTCYTTGAFTTTTETDVGNSTDADGRGFELDHPPSGIWKFNITNATSCGIKLFDRAAFDGPGIGAIGFEIQPSSGSNSMDSLICNDPSTGLYTRIRNVFLNNDPGATFANGLLHLKAVADGNFIEGVHIRNSSGIGMAINGCCSTTVLNSQFNGNAGTGAIPISMITNSGGAGFNDVGVNLFSISAVHPGAASNNVHMTNPAGNCVGVHFYGLYMEGPLGTADTTTPSFDDGCESTLVEGAVLGLDVAASTRYMFQLETGSGCFFTGHDLESYQQSTNIVNDLCNSVTVTAPSLFTPINYTNMPSWSIGTSTFKKSINLIETTAPTALANQDVFYGDSTSHWPKFNPNNVGFGFVGALGLSNPTTGNSPTTYQCAITSDAQDCFIFTDSSTGTGGTLTNGLANQALLNLLTFQNSTETPLEIQQNTITNTVATPAAQVEMTWNNAGLVGRGLVVSVTNTASAAGSYPFEVQNAGTVQFGVSPTGVTSIGAVGGTSGTINLNGTTSGTATITGPAVAGTLTNPVISSNEFQIGVAGTAGGILALGGSTSGIATLTAPAVAGTLTNATVSSNALQAGVAGTAGGILAMGGSTSGIATLTAPAVAGTLSNAIISSNALQAGAAGGAGGVLGVGGSTSGVATFTAPAVAGTLTNPVISSNAFQVGAAGGAGGKLLLGGSTSGTATFTAPAVAGTLTNAVISSNALQAGAAGTAGGILAVGGSTSGVATFTAPAVAGTVTNPVVASNSLQVPDLVITNLLISNTAPTIAAGGCGGSAASITAPNGTGSFEVNTGTTPGSACTITMPAATTSWTCDANTVSATSTTNFIVKQTGAISTTSVVLTLFTDAAATQAYTGSDTLRVKCSAN